MSTTYFLWDETDVNVIEEYDENFDKTVEYTHEPGLYGGIISQHRNGATSFYHEDALGNTVALTDESENVTDTYEYDAWGNEVSHAGTTENPFRWNGQAGYYFESASSQYYVRQRVYSPILARWLSVDPMTTYYLLHAYAYVANCPSNWKDPSGMQEEEKSFSVEIRPTFEDLDNKKCGDNAQIGWIFRIKGGTKFEGYFIQKVDITCAVNECDNCQAPPQSYTFYEAFRVDGDGKMIDFDEITVVNGKNFVITDQALGAAVNEKCGEYIANGEVRFFLKSPQTAAVDNWKKGLSHGEGFCKTSVNKLPSSSDPPPWWNNDQSVSLFASAKRSFSIKWNCCPCNETKPVVSASPRKS
ncbi:RHS repeat domain-containing protein [Thalassoglobus sp.]|uniref:RHS repeat domain-containing protein n=1 Tax=Thalassoglobus sp. TaxID=2795869 RepID=UPI003AA8EF37